MSVVEAGERRVGTFDPGAYQRGAPPTVGRIRLRMRLKVHTVRPRWEAASAPLALLIALFFLACHVAPGIIHQSAHVEAAGAHHGVSAPAAAGHSGSAHEAPGGQTQDAAQNGSGMSANYAAALLILVLGAAMLLAAERAVRRAPRAIMSRSFAPPRPRWRPPPPPTPVRLQVFRL